MELSCRSWPPTTVPQTASFGDNRALFADVTAIPELVPKSFEYAI